MDIREELKNVSYQITPFTKQDGGTVEFFADSSNRPVWGATAELKQAGKPFSMDYAIAQADRMRAGLATVLVRDGFSEIDNDGPTIFYDFVDRDGEIGTQASKVVIVTHDAWELGGNSLESGYCWVKRQCFSFDINPVSADGRVEDRDGLNGLRATTLESVVADYPALSTILERRVPERYLDALRATTVAPGF